jgi:hypothetical protein
MVSYEDVFIYYDGILHLNVTNDTQGKPDLDS